MITILINNSNNYNTATTTTTTDNNDNDNTNNGNHTSSNNINVCYPNTDDSQDNNTKDTPPIDPNKHMCAGDVSWKSTCDVGRGVVRRV